MKVTVNLLNEYISLKVRREELIAQRARIQDKERNYKAECNAMVSDVEEARRKLAADDKKCIRDKITEEELAASKEQINILLNKFEETKRLQELAIAAIPDIDTEIRDTVNQIRSATRNYCMGVKQQIIDSIDDKVRKTLLEAYAAVKIPGEYSIQGATNWIHFITGVFPEPVAPEVKKAIDEFKAEHKI